MHLFNKKQPITFMLLCVAWEAIFHIPLAECFFSVLKREMYFGHEQEFITNEQLEIAISD